jgi:t-SNARE complex subunit (syntaxin)
MGKPANAIVRLGPVGVAEIAGREVFNQAMGNRHRKGKLRAALKTTQLRVAQAQKGQAVGAELCS